MGIKKGVSRRRTGIEWTEETWNPTRGCSVISPGCHNCYAMMQARRFSGPGKAYEGLTKMTRSGPRWTGEVRLAEEKVNLPLRRRTPKIFFVDSMSDLFHEKIPEESIDRVFDVMKRADRHVFQVLTKRSQRLVELCPRLPWPANIWMGVSVENAEYLWRVDHLRSVSAAVRFLSLEPLLGPIHGLSLKGIHWVIVGGESGPRRRPIEASWVRDIRDRCLEANVPFFFKQWGGRTPKEEGCTLDGREWKQMPS